MEIEENTANLTFSRVNFNNNGLGIWVYSGKSFTVDRCQFNQNGAGGIETTGFDRLIIRNSTFKNNSRWVNGAGVHANGVRSIVLEKNTFIGNQTSYNMGGAFLGGTPATTSITVKNNIFDSNSGGLSVRNLYAGYPMGTALISGNKFINNSRGGLSADMAKTIKIYGNVLYRNKGYGSAILAYDSPNIDVQNNVVANNVVDMWNSDWPAVGVMASRDGDLVKIINNTITANERTNPNAGGGGLGLWLSGNSSKALIVTTNPPHSSLCCSHA